MSMTPAQQREAYRRMQRIRKFEEEGSRLYREGAIPGAYHASIGQEAAIVGACLALRDDDYITGTHRSHGHPIGKGAHLDALMAELMGKITGICKGRGGSMHLADSSVGILGESAIVGGGIPLAAGAALSAKARGTDQVGLTFFGDGASNQGTFHETLNMAASWKLPAIFFCENNLYAVTTAVAESHGQPDIAKRAAGYGIPGIIVDGQDVTAVYEVTHTAVQRARRGEGPSLIEAKTYRFDEHSVELDTIGEPYRAAAEVRDYIQHRDPLRLFETVLLQSGFSAAELSAIAEDAAAAVAQAIAFGQQSPLPDPADVYQYMYVNPIRYPKVPHEDAIMNSTTQAQTTRISYIDAIGQAQTEEMHRDERVILMGQDLAVYGDAKVLKSFGPLRVWNTPISENSASGLAVGAAMTGMRPIISLSIASFMYLACDQIINQAGKLHYMTGGQMRVPVVFRCALFYNNALAAQHSDRCHPLFMNAPGLKIIAPTTPADMKGLLKSAIRDDDPVVVFEDSTLWGVKENVSTDPDLLVPIGEADIKHPGSDVTIVAIAGCMKPALAAAQELKAEGISVEVIDPRTLVPMDTETIIKSLAKTGRLVVVDVANRTCNAAAEIAATIAEEAFEYLRKPIVRLSTPDVHIPFSPIMEKPLYPNKEAIIAAVRRLLS